MGNIINPQDVWDFVNTYNEIRTETAGTADGSSQTFSLENKYLITGSEKIYTDGSQMTSGIVVDYDEGKITLTANTGSVVTCDYNYSSIPNSVIEDFIIQIEDKLENLSRRKFNLTNRTEYLSVDKNQKTFFTKYYPVVTCSVSRNKNAVTDTANWEVLSEGIGEDYIMNDEDKEIGRIRFIDKFPSCGTDKLKIIYSYGYSDGSIPSIIKELAVLETSRKILDSTIYKAYVGGQEGFSPARIEQIDDRINELRKIIKRDEISII